MTSRPAALVLACIGVAIAADGQAVAATVTNRDAVAQVVSVTTKVGKVDVVVKSGETLELCPDGCFVTFPNGDKAALSGAETIEIHDGAGHIGN